MSIDLIQLLDETINAFFNREEFITIIQKGAVIEFINGSVAFGEYKSIIERMRRMDKKGVVQ